MRLVTSLASLLTLTGLSVGSTLDRCEKILIKDVKPVPLLEFGSNSKVNGLYNYYEFSQR